MNETLLKSRPYDFVEFGFVVVRDLLPRNLLSDIQRRVHDIVRLRAEYADSISTLNKEGKINQHFTNKLYLGLVIDDIEHHKFIYDHLRHVPELFRLVVNERVLEEVQNCLGLKREDALSVSNVQLRIDRPNDPWKENLGWHQDSVYFNSMSRTGWSLGLWTPVFNCDLDLGPPTLIIGSHRHGRIKHVSVKHGLSESPYLNIDSSQTFLSSGKEISIYLNAGDVLLFDLDLIHRSSRNQTLNSIRWSIQARYHVMEGSIKNA